MGNFKRRANGMGTVYKLSGNRRNPYVAIAPAYEGENGKTARKAIGYFATQKEAENALSAYRSAPPAIALDITLEALYKQWSETGYKNISRQAKYSYTAAWEKLKPIHKMKVKDVKTPQLQFCVDTVAETGASKSTIDNIIIVAGKLMNFAAQQDLITKNYAQFVVRPKTEKPERASFSDLELKKIEYGAKNGVGISAHILIMCYTGWRIQEYCSLTIFDYDKIEHTLTGGLKTTAGINRVVPVPEKIRPYVEMQFERSERICNFSSQKLRKEFYTTMDLLGIQKEDERKYTPHSTRHTYNSLLANTGIDVDTRMKLMGQTDAKTNINTYTHLDVETLKKAVENL
ncbi:MAG: tyrosine-type recombinase/integrase [Clostridia bacterium]|nr:tyrosine-type recombinase/integrase [Clostridia bacterium]